MLGKFLHLATIVAIVLGASSKIIRILPHSQSKARILKPHPPSLTTSAQIRLPSRTEQIQTSLLQINTDLLANLMNDCSLFHLVNFAGLKPHVIIDRLSSVLGGIEELQKILTLRFDCKEIKPAITDRISHNKLSIKKAIVLQAQLPEEAEKSMSKNKLRATNTAEKKDRRPPIVFDKTLITSTYSQALKDVFAVYNSVAVICNR
jgi:hypothetical protein